MRHAVATVEPVLGLYFPAGHSVQVEPAPPVEYVPAGQLASAVIPPIVLQSFPGGHVLPTVSPGIGQYVLIGHCNGVLPLAGQYVPGGHINLPPEPCTEGLVLPVNSMLPPAPAGGPGQYWPAVQFVHDVALPALHWPAGQ